MSWKDWPGWLKGGLFGLIASLIICLSLWGFLYEQIVYDGCHSREKPEDIYSQCDLINDQLKSSTISAEYNTSFLISYVFIFIVISVLLFTIGSFIGWIIPSSKKWSYWLKGSFVGMLIGSLLWTILFLVLILTGEALLQGGITGFGGSGPTFSEDPLGFTFLYILMTFIPFFILLVILFIGGALIGWIYGKIKDTYFWKVLRKTFFISITLYLLISIIFWLFNDCSKVPIVGNQFAQVSCISTINYFEMIFATELIFLFPALLIVGTIFGLVYNKIKEKRLVSAMNNKIVEISQKSWPYWLKGLVIGVIVAFVFAMVFSLITLSKGGYPYEGSFLKRLIVGWILRLSYGVVLGPIGAIIGLIYGKIKSKKAS